MNNYKIYKNEQGKYYIKKRFIVIFWRYILEYHPFIDGGRIKLFTSLKDALDFIEHQKTLKPDKLIKTN